MPSRDAAREAAGSLEVSAGVSRRAPRAATLGVYVLRRFSVGTAYGGLVGRPERVYERQADMQRPEHVACVSTPAELVSGGIVRG